MYLVDLDNNYLKIFTKIYCTKIPDHIEIVIINETNIYIIIAYLKEYIIWENVKFYLKLIWVMYNFYNIINDVFFIKGYEYSLLVFS